MNKVLAHSCLKTFFEISKMKVDSKNSILRMLERKKRFLGSNAKRYANEKIDEVREERDMILGKLDAVRLELLDIIIDRPNLISEDLLKQKGYSTVTQFVALEKEKIEHRGLYQKYPYSIAEVLIDAYNLDENKLDPIPSLFVKTTDETCEKVEFVHETVKTMIKGL